MNALPAKIPLRELLWNINPGIVAGYESWHFHPGMKFKDLEKWWGSGGTRSHPHEGVDFCYFRDKTREIHSLGPGTCIPMLYDGMITAIQKDFIGQSVFIRHTDYTSDNRILYSIFGHTQLEEELNTGQFRAKGEGIARIADTRHTKSRITPHWHLTLAWVPREEKSGERISWQLINDASRIILLDPLRYIY